MVWPTHKPPRGGPARGAGYGGSAKGMPLQPQMSAERQPTHEARMAGIEEGRTARAVAKSHAEEMANLMVTIARDPEAPMTTRLDAANKLIERAEGKAPASLDMTSAGGPLTVVLRRFVEDVPE